MPKVFIKELETKNIPAGSVEDLNYLGVELSQSALKENMPILGVMVRNKSNEEIRVILNGLPDNGFTLAAGGTQGLTGIPFTMLRILNKGVAQIAAGDINIVLFNDMELCRDYDYALKASHVYNYERR